MPQVPSPRRRLRAALPCVAALATCALLAAGWRAPAAGPPRDAANKAPARAGEQPLNPQGTVLLDVAGRRVLLKTEVVLREGQLEMLCCLKQTKEHESILSLDAKAYVVHAGLLALGAKPGAPVSHHPKFTPPTGQKVAIYVNWTDENGKPRRVAAQSWVRHSIHRFWSNPLAKLPEGLNLPRNTELRYDPELKELSWYGPMSERDRDRFVALSQDRAFRKSILYFYEQGQPREMRADWVFCGSALFRDPDTGKEFYLAEEGDLICVANFPSATIDVAVASSAQAEAAEGGLLFEAFTERIPPKGTPVTVELIPVFDNAKRN